MQDFFYIKSGNRYLQVCFSDILYIEAKDKYTAVTTAKENLLTLQSLNNIERALPARLFCRIHRSYIISLTHTKWFDHTTAVVGDKKLPIGKVYKDVLPARVMIYSNEPNSIISLSDYDILNLLRQMKSN